MAGYNIIVIVFADYFVVRIFFINLRSVSIFKYAIWSVKTAKAEKQ